MTYMPPLGQPPAPIYSASPQMPWQTPPAPQPVGPPALPARPSRRYLVGFAIASAAITVLALVLAIVAPAFQHRTADIIPAGWTRRFNGGPSSDQWATSAGCDVRGILGGRLTATSTSATGDGVSCAYLPSTNGDLTSGGIAISATVVPERSSARVGPTLFIGEHIMFAINDQGTFLLQDDRELLHSGSTVAWHTDDETPNTLTLVLAPDGTLTAFVNDQYVYTGKATVPWHAAIGVGALAGRSATFSNVTISTGS